MFRRLKNFLIFSTGTVFGSFLMAFFTLRFIFTNKYIGPEAKEIVSDTASVFFQKLLFPDTELRPRRRSYTDYNRVNRRPDYKSAASVTFREPTENSKEEENGTS